MATEAVLRMRRHLDSIGDCVHPHPEWVTDCWFCGGIAAIEAEAVAARNAEIAEAVRGIPMGPGRFSTTGDTSEFIGNVWAYRAAVLAIIDRDAA